MKKIALILALLLIATNVFWVYCAIDQGVTHTYREASFDTLNSSFKSLLTLSAPLFKGKQVSEIRALAKGKIDPSEVFDKLQGGDSGEDLLIVGGLVFHIDSQGRVSGVSGE